ncbi:Leucine-rich repeat-containing protein 58 [Acropora cervicornis]|uniref:Leucine-rich repeat-containing protein 58 n=1 Tax=Acropora cervicornis TaxID=6130 RepID=A0AAD9VGE3_ACRCE|nr:Leucine-rich repeat-containing protein 58 [Acropora cervicornis]
MSVLIDSMIAMDKGENSEGGGRPELEECDLNLAHRSLDSLPDDVHVRNNLPHAYKITSLNLVGNRVPVLPDSLGNFINLKVLDISGNGLAYITPRIGDLRHLRSFVAKNNNLEDLPKEFSQLLALEHLNLSGNRFESFFPQMFELVSLKSLLFGGNRVDVIPQDIQNLQRLEILYLGGNQLSSVPNELGTLRRLRALNLCDNKIESLPSTLVKLTHLQSLHLHNNRLTTLPVELVKLRNLEELSLRENPLVVRFVRDMAFNPPTLLELSGRCIKNSGLKYSFSDLPSQLLQYLNSARRCVNPCCKGVYFDARVKHIKFVDFCGKYRLPLEQYLCSPHEGERWDDCTSSSSEDEVDGVPRERLRKVLLG